MIAALAVLLRDWRLIALALSVAIIWVQEVRLDQAQANASDAKAELASDRATYARTKADAESATRAEESRREAEKEKVIDEARIQTSAAEAAAHDADHAAAGLRQQVATLAAADRRAAADPGPAVGGPPAVDAVGLLANVLSLVDDRAGSLAAEADRRGIAGAACERAYDSLTISLAPT